jgi:glycopeptide antibiotics resistance protein
MSPFLEKGELSFSLFLIVITPFPKLNRAAIVPATNTILLNFAIDLPFIFILPYYFDVVERNKSGWKKWRKRRREREEAI